jgi:hypothetical protein
VKKSKALMQWEQFLNPEKLRTNLILASIFIAYYEILQESIIDRIKDFFATEWRQGKPVTSEKYRQQIASRNRSPVYASLSWLQEVGAIDKSDMAKFEGIKKCRNELAHELRELILNGIELRHIDAFKDLVSLMQKIETWWIWNVEIPTDPEQNDFEDIKQTDIVPGMVLSLKILFDVALGDEKLSKSYYDEIIKNTKII